jgi:hypothetical protein
VFERGCGTPNHLAVDVTSELDDGIDETSEVGEVRSFGEMKPVIEKYDGVVVHVRVEDSLFQFHHYAREVEVHSVICCLFV